MVYKYIIYITYNTGSTEISLYLPNGNTVGIGLSTNMIVTINLKACESCSLQLEIVPPYFTNNQIDQPMLNLENSVVR